MSVELLEKIRKSIPATKQHMSHLMGYRSPNSYYNLLTEEVAITKQTLMLAYWVNEHHVPGQLYKTELLEKIDES